MRRLTNRIIHIVILCLAFTANICVAGEWELQKDKDGIQVFTRAISGSDVKAFRGETIVNAELNSIMALLDDTAAFGNWMYQSKNPKLLHKVSLLDRYQYMVNDLPWPAADRALLMRNEITQDIETRVTTVRLTGVSKDKLPAAARDALPKLGKAVLVTELTGFYELSPISGTHTRVVFQLHLNPEGKLPASIVNSQLVDNPYETLKAMRGQATQAKYQHFKPF